ncbi:hypothetical protein TanjilG_25228 [Lupinus angustifolius]|uniref:Uncharacterized protein n=1 Tax=Lupinus angustifolius TaxID=3871 RepID=A0A1J7GKU1_LUPAN|nr:PREDICTED: uncharacterized protein LOC109359327 [Lupinus angustifolius]OIW01120.1 hypothetical protein TanjilG_25228 [Lupinus angustifolius]
MVRKKKFEMVEDDSDSDIETLESDIKQMAHKLLQYRSTLPDQLNNTLVSLLATHRPHFPQPSALELNICSGENSSAPEDQEIAKKVKLLNEKISSNCSAMPVVLKNMKDCIAKFDKLDSYNAIVHPAFKRKRSG